MKALTSSRRFGINVGEVRYEGCVLRCWVGGRAILDVITKHRLLKQRGTTIIISNRGPLKGVT